MYRLLPALAFAIALAAVPSATFAAPNETTPVWRAQIRLATAFQGGAGTNDDVRVLLNDSNVTWLDYAHNDFEPGSSLTYDLVLTNVRTLADITSLRVSKPFGADDWCAQSLELLVNGQPIFQRSLGTFLSPCRRVTSSSDIAIAGSTLRSHPLWQTFTQPAAPGGMPRAEIESRVESLLGTYMQPNPLGWDTLLVTPFSVGRRDNQAVFVAVSLRHVGNLGNSDADALFDLRFSCSGGAMTASVQNLSLNILGPMSDDEVQSLFSFIRTDLQRSFTESLQRARPLSGGPIVGQSTFACPTISVESDADVVFSPVVLQAAQ
jgi:hypothetical protein